MTNQTITTKPAGAGTPLTLIKIDVAPADDAGPFAFFVRACTDVIGGDVLNTIYREELMLVDPDAALEDGCFVVVQSEHGRPRVQSWWLTGRDQNGRFVPAGDPRECFALGNAFSYSAEDLARRYLRIIGRAVGKYRHITYDRVPFPPPTLPNAFRPLAPLPESPSGFGRRLFR